MNFNSLNVIPSLKEGRFICGFRYPISDLIQKSIPRAHASRIDLLTNWLTDYRKKLINEWLNEIMSLQCPFDLSQIFFFKIPRLQCPNQGSHMMEFLLLSPKSVCMIVIRALTGMQLRSNEEKMLRWQKHGVFCVSIKNSSKLLFSRLELFERSWTRGD